MANAGSCFRQCIHNSFKASTHFSTEKVRHLTNTINRHQRNGIKEIVTAMCVYGQLHLQKMFQKNAY